MAGKNVAAAGVLIAASLCFLAIALGLPDNARQPFDPGPGFFPAMMLYGIIGLSVLLLIQTFVGKRRKAKREGPLPEAEPGPEAAASPEAEPKADYAKFAVVLLLVILYAVLLTRIGMVLTNLLFVFGVLALYSRKWVSALLISLAYTAVLYIVFILIVRVYFETDIVADWLKAILP